MTKPTGRKPPKDASLKRRIEFRTPKRTFLVFCEGTKTEPDYLRALKREPAVRDSASVEIRMELNESGVMPLTLAKAAVGARKRASEEQGEIDEVWCLFDIEAPRKHPHLAEARDTARAGGVRLAVSNPCFELWLALHFQNQSASLSTKEAKKLRQQHDKSSGKEVDGAKYMPRRERAAERARDLTAKHAREERKYPDDNPSSGMHLLFEAIAAEKNGR